jgi:hypothetical protein
MGSVRWSVVTAVVVALVPGSGVLAPAVRALPPAFAAVGLVDPCTEAPLVVSYDVAFAPELGEYAVTGVRVAGLPAACADGELRVTLSAADGSTLADAVAVRSGDAHVAGLTTAVPASAVVDVSAVLQHGPPVGARP